MDTPAKKDMDASVYFYHEGIFFKGAEAIFELYAVGAKKTHWKWMYNKIGGLKFLAELGYFCVAKNRKWLSKISQVLYGKFEKESGGIDRLHSRVFANSKETWFSEDVVYQNRIETYVIAQSLFFRGMGLVYLLAFGSLFFQVIGLFGSHGILPISTYAERIISVSKELSFPSIFLFFNSDTFLITATVMGVISGGLMIVGLLPGITSFVSWVLYLSFVTVGQEFMSYQWDVLLLEAGFLLLFFVPWGGSIFNQPTKKPSRLILFMLKLLLFRLMFTAGVVKLISGDNTWKTFMSLDYHFYTQPLPHFMSWYAHQLPLYIKKIGVGFAFFVELVVPFLFFMPRRPRHLAFLLTTLFMIFIMATGNYGFFNILVIVLSFILLDDYFILSRIPKWVKKMIDLRYRVVPERKVRKYLNRGIVCCLLVPMLYMESSRFITDRLIVPKPVQFLGGVAQHFRLFSPYGLFAVMTTKRKEVVIQASLDGETWKDYEFKWKPGAVNIAPKWAFPHQPRLDWQLWFSALSTIENNSWMYHYFVKLIQGSESVLSLMGPSPFGNKKPNYIQAQLYDYTFTELDDMKGTGYWWKRTYVGPYSPTLQLSK
jgi:lipase maturation factor 1